MINDGSTFSFMSIELLLGVSENLKIRYLGQTNNTMSLPKT